MQMLPPCVTCPVINSNRGRTTRTKGGSNGKFLVKLSSSSTAAGNSCSVSSANLRKPRSSGSCGSSSGAVISAFHVNPSASSEISTPMPSRPPFSSSSLSDLNSRISARVAPALAPCSCTFFHASSTACSASDDSKAAVDDDRAGAGASSVCTHPKSSSSDSSSSDRGDDVSGGRSRLGMFVCCAAVQRASAHKAQAECARAGADNSASEGRLAKGAA